MTIKNYEVVIKTLGPVHIGSGQVMKKQDYIYDFYNSKVYMINGNKLVKFLKAMCQAKIKIFFKKFQKSLLKEN